MITLTHTRMRVPNDRIRVTSLKQVDVGCGIAWSAVLRADRRTLGAITNDGHGGATLFRPEDSEARNTVDRFVSKCRDHHGESMSEESVLDNLANEYEYARDVARAERAGQYLVRYFDRVDIPGFIRFELTRTAPPDYDGALRATARLTLPEEAVRAELWMGQRGWIEFHRTEEADDQYPQGPR
ncbi:hypothetical protein [Nocardiopsis sp. FR4]|uniref:hypothetical protein n=1 Tax=Nocardiopsis sp. FR4 TaxID=2605985 RepID=UPI00135CA85B|nr:hypothetical protein [Nocardiopsis sp. FR4]